MRLLVCELGSLTPWVDLALPDPAEVRQAFLLPLYHNFFIFLPEFFAFTVFLLFLLRSDSLAVLSASRCTSSLCVHRFHGVVVVVACIPVCLCQWWPSLRPYIHSSGFEPIDNNSVCSVTQHLGKSLTRGEPVRVFMGCVRDFHPILARVKEFSSVRAFPRWAARGLR